MELALGILAGLLVAIYVSVADRNLATLAVRDRDLVVTMRGLNALWALKRQVLIPISAVTDARVADARKLRWGWRLPGTAIPGLIFAGSYLKDGAWSFFAVRRGEEAVIIETDQTRFQRVVFETADPYGALSLIEEARRNTFSKGDPTTKRRASRRSRPQEAALSGLERPPATSGDNRRDSRGDSALPTTPRALGRTEGFPFDHGLPGYGTVWRRFETIGAAAAWPRSHLPSSEVRGAMKIFTMADQIQDL